MSYQSTGLWIESWPLHETGRCAMTVTVVALEVSTVTYDPYVIMATLKTVVKCSFVVVPQLITLTLTMSHSR